MPGIEYDEGGGGSMEMEGVEKHKILKLIYWESF